MVGRCASGGTEPTWHCVGQRPARGQDSQETPVQATGQNHDAPQTSQAKMKPDLVQFLVDQTPVFDALVVEDIRPADSPKYFHVLPIDVRLLPNTLRPIFAESDFVSIKTVRRRFKMSRPKFRKVKQSASDLLLSRLNVWLDSLPKRKRNRELKKRWFADGWIGKVTTGEFPVMTDKFD